MSNATISESRPLQRSATDRKLLGVCGGFAEQYGLDPLLVRITVAVLVLFGGLGVLLYLIGAAWLPEPGRTSDAVTGQRFLLIVLAVGAALIVLPARFVLGFGDGITFLVAAGLFVLMIMLVRRPAAVPLTSSMAAPPAAEPAAPTLADVEEYATTPYPQAPTEPYVPPPAYPTGPRPPKRRSYLGLITLCASLMWFGLAWAMNAADITTMSAVAIFAGSLAILGIGMIVGAWYGRARWLVLLALPLALVVWGLAAVPQQVQLGQAANWAGEGIGETTFQPTATNSDEFAWGFGSATLDVADWAAYPGVRQVSVSVGAGEAGGLRAGRLERGRGCLRGVRLDHGRRELDGAGRRHRRPDRPLGGRSIHRCAVAADRRDRRPGPDLGAVRQLAAAGHFGAPSPGRPAAAGHPVPAPDAAVPPAPEAAVQPVNPAQEDAA